MRRKNVNAAQSPSACGIKYSKGAFSLDIFTTKQSVPNTIIILFILFRSFKTRAVYRTKSNRREIYAPNNKINVRVIMFTFYWEILCGGVPAVEGVRRRREKRRAHVYRYMHILCFTFFCVVRKEKKKNDHSGHVPRSKKVCVFFFFCLF